MKNSRTVQTPAIILKRNNFGEKDRILTLYSEKQGKVSVIAKGCRDLKSSRLSMLEPGNLINAYMILTKSMPILTETKIINSFINSRTSLLRMKHLSQVLEIIDRLSVEENNLEVFAHVIQILEYLNSPKYQIQTIQNMISALIEYLGFQKFEDTTYTTLTEYVSNIADKPMRSYDYLTVKS